MCNYVVKKSEAFDGSPEPAASSIAFLKSIMASRHMRVAGRSFFADRIDGSGAQETIMAEGQRCRANSK
jgi:hypothetical protein